MSSGSGGVNGYLLYGGSRSPVQTRVDSKIRVFHGWAGNERPQISVGIANVDIRRIVAVKRDDGSCGVGGRRSATWG